MIHINGVIRAVVLADKGAKQNTMDLTNFPVEGPQTSYNSNFSGITEADNVTDALL